MLRQAYFGVGSCWADRTIPTEKSVTQVFMLKIECSNFYIFHSLSTSSVVDTSLLSRTDTAVHLCQHSSIYQLEEHKLGLWVKGLLLGRVFLLLVQSLSLSLVREKTVLNIKLINKTSRRGRIICLHVTNFSPTECLRSRQPPYSGQLVCPLFFKSFQHAAY